MLVLTRKEGQTILIGHDIAIVIKGIDRHGNVRIGIDAPQEVNILRKELVAKPRAKAFIPGPTGDQG